MPIITDKDIVFDKPVKGAALRAEDIIFDAPEEEVGIGSAAVRGIQAVPSMWKSQAAGAEYMAERLVGNTPRGDYDPTFMPEGGAELERRQPSTVPIQAYREAQKNIKDIRGNIKEGSAADYTFKILSNVGAQAPALATTGLIGSTVPALTGMGIGSGAEQFASMKEKGASDIRATGGAVATGIGEALTELIPLGVVKNVIAGNTSWLRGVLGIAVTDLPGELIQTINQNTHDWLLEKANKGEKPTWAEWGRDVAGNFEELKDTAIVSLGTSLLMGGAAGMGARFKQGRTPTEAAPEKMGLDVNALQGDIVQEEAAPIEQAPVAEQVAPVAEQTREPVPESVQAEGQAIDEADIIFDEGIETRTIPPQTPYATKEEAMAALDEIERRGTEKALGVPITPKSEYIAPQVSPEGAVSPVGEIEQESETEVDEWAVTPEIISKLQSEYDQAKARLDELGPEPHKPSTESKAFGKAGKSGALPEHVARWEAEDRAYKTWRRKYGALKKAEVEASNALFYAKKAQTNEGLGQEGALDIGKFTAKVTDPEYAKAVEQGAITELQSPEEVSWFKNALKRMIVYPRTVAKKFPKFNGIFERTRQYFADRDNKAFEIAAMGKPYFNLPNKTRVNEVMAWARQQGKQYVPTQQNLQAAGLTQPEIDAVFAVKAMMDTQLSNIEEALMYRLDARGMQPTHPDYQEELSKIRKMMLELRRANYVPFSRFGDYFVSVKDAQGQILHYSLHESAKDMQKEALAWKNKGAKNISTGNHLQAAPEAMKQRMDDLVMGFPTHLLKSKNTLGFNKDLERNIADYILKGTNYTEWLKWKTDTTPMLQNIDPKKEGGLFSYSSKYLDYIETPGNEGAAFRNFLFHYYLGGNMKSALMNLTQTGTTTYPQLAKYYKGAGAEVAISKAIAMAFSKKMRGQGLQAAIDKAIADGVLTEQQITDLRGKARPNITGKRMLSDYLAYAFKEAEYANRLVAFIAGYRAAVDKKGLTGDAAIKFAEDFVDETQFIYNKVNRPEIQRGWRAPLFTFRNFQGNYLSLLKRNMQDKEYATVVRMLAMMFAVAGGTGWPLVKEFIKIAEIAGRDPKQWVKENTGAHDILMHGLLFPLGVDVSGALGIGELVPDLEQGAAAAIGKTVGGVAIDPAMRLGKAKYMGYDKNSPYRAIESVMPEAIKNPMVAARWYREGAIRNPDREPIVTDPTKSEIALKALGIQPSRLTEAYEKDNSKRLLRKRITDTNAKYNYWMAEARFNQDYPRVQKLIQEIRKNNEGATPDRMIRLNEAAIQEHVKNMNIPPEARVKGFPKQGRQQLNEINR